MLGLAFANLNIFYKKSLHPHFFITTLGGGIYMEKNIKLFKLYSLLTGKFFVGTTQVLFLKFKGFSFTEIMLISTITGICSLIFEIPSGMLADRIGYKKCINYGLLITIIANIIIIFADNFIYIVFYSVLTALGSSAISGADYALLYESLNKVGHSELFKDTIRKINSIKMYFVAVVTIFSGVLYKVNEYLPFVCTTVIYILAFVVSIMFTDVKKTVNEEQKLINYFKLSMSAIKDNKRLRWLFVAGALFAVLFLNQNILLQQYMDDIGLNVALFGVIFFIYNLITAFVSKRSGKLEGVFGKHTKSIFTLLIAVCFVVAGICRNYIGIVFLSLCRISIATINPIMDAEVNEQIDSAHRATLLSCYNALSTVADSVVSPFIGITIEELGIFSTYIIMGLASIFFVFYLLTEKFGIGKN